VGRVSEFCLDCNHPTAEHGTEGCTAVKSVQGGLTYYDCGCSRAPERATAELNGQSVSMPAAVAVARPGDTLVVGFPIALSDRDRDELAETFRPLTEQGIKVAFADHVTSMVVAKGDGS
jgi:hypothetical protein